MVTQEQTNSLVLMTDLDLPAQTSASESRGFLVDEPSIWLPSPEYWLQSPKDPIETPRDALGLIDIEALIVAVKKTVDPAFNWSSKDSTHHFYWPDANYLYANGWSKGRRTFNESSFREMPIHKGELPRVFENWLHVITLPPEKPSREVMEYRMEGYNAAKSLFRSVREVIVWMKRLDRRANNLVNNSNFIKSSDNNVYGHNYMANMIEKHLKSMDQHNTALEQVPREFRLIEPSDSPHELARNLGRFVTKRSMKWGRKVYEPLVA